jgi:hypothetical protein
MDANLSRRPRVKALWRLALWLPLVGVLSAVLALLLAVSAVPAVLQGDVAAEVDAQAWVSFRHRLPRGSLMALLEGQPIEVQVSAAEAQVVAASLARKFAGGAAEVTLGVDQAQVQLAVPVARTPLRAWLPDAWWFNVDTVWHMPAAGGPPELTAVSLGRLPLPPAVVWAVARHAAQWAGVPGAVDMALDMVAQAQVTPSQATLRLHMSDELKRRGFALVVPPQDWPALPEQRKVLVQALATRGCALSGVLHAMFERARQRTMGQALMGAGGGGGEPQEAAARENRVVLLVAAMHAVKWPVQRALPGADLWIDQDTADLCLNGRVDFAQHYLLSALLSSQAGSRAASAIGLFKEVLDSTPGQQGSGFSFNDIAADLAGTRLGARARQEPVRLQFQATEARADTDWMPDVRDLPQFMSAQQVQQQYGGPGSPAFDRMWSDIQQRVDRLPVLR